MVARVISVIFESMSWTSTWAPRHTLLWILVAINVGGILLAGLSLRGFDFRNNVEWASDGTGIEFGEHGLAYTDTFTTGEDTDQRTRQDFTIEIALRPHESSESGFRFIAVVHGGDDDEQLVIAGRVNLDEIGDREHWPPCAEGRRPVNGGGGRSTR